MNWDCLTIVFLGAVLVVVGSVYTLLAVTTIGQILVGAGLLFIAMKGFGKFLNDC